MKKIDKICTQKSKKMCKLTSRHKQKLLKKQETFSKYGKELPQKDLKDMALYDILNKGIEICNGRPTAPCKRITLSDIPYDIKFLMNSFKDEFINPLFSSFTQEKDPKKKQITNALTNKTTGSLSEVYTRSKKLPKTISKVSGKAFDNSIGETKEYKNTKQKMKTLKTTLKKKLRSAFFKQKK